MRQPALSLADVPAELRARIEPVRTLSYPPQGATSTVAIIEGADGWVVLKHARGRRWSAWLARENAVLRALAGSDLPIPRVLAYVADQHAGQPAGWLLMSHLPGEPLETVLARLNHAGAREQLLYAWGALLRRIHQTPIPEVLRAPGPWLDAQLAEARYNLAHDRVDGSPALLQRLEDIPPPPIAETLIHGDYTLDNTLVADGVISGLIDWARGGPGDPRYDLALATRPTRAALRRRADQAAFWQGYGSQPPDATTLHYFVDLYEFF